MGARHQRRRPHQHPPLYDGQTARRPRVERLHSARNAGGKTFDGNRWNNLHYTNEFKRAARERHAAAAAKNP
jgi:hypothetical protein